MELVYLYCNKFRNLSDVGFNFSPSYEFTYELELNKLEFVNKRKRFDGFFGPQIVNVTGIVGMNASGKSNLLDLICHLTKGTSTQISSYIMIFCDKSHSLDEFYYKTNLENIKLDNFDANKLSPIKSVPNLSVMFFSNVSDGRNQNFPKEVIDLSQNARQFPQNKTSDVYKQVKFLLSEYSENVRINYPESLLISIKYLKQFNLAGSRFSHEVRNYVKLYDRFKKRTLNPIESFRYSFRFGLFTFLIKSISGPATYRNSDNENIEQKIDFLSALMGDHFDGVTEFGSLSKLHNKLEQVIREYVKQCPSEKGWTAKDILILLEFDKHIERLNPQFLEEKISNNSYMKFSFDETNRSIFRDFLPFFDFPDVLSIEWTGISSGHKAFLNLFAQFHSAIKRVSQHDHVLICIDEGDLYLHPAWQREFLNRLVSYVPEILKKNIQLILTTHSPFLVSDLPRENVILLLPGKEGMCEIVEVKDSMGNTFGANILDLFMGSFFLQDGVIGEFSLLKIREAIEIIQNTNSNEKELKKARQITNLIGDEFIQSKLFKMLNDDKN